MESPMRPPASPGTPLYAMSPERANRQVLPQSPSLTSSLRDDPFLTSPTRSSDVANKVLQFNNMTKDKQRNNEAALRRAVVGREEAESETRRLREEHATLKKNIEAGKARELKVAQRLESVMEEMQQLQEIGEHKHTVYEKEVRRARKEAFKSSSALVQMQEELKTTRNRYTLMREGVEEQKRKVEVREKEIFDAQFVHISLQQEMDELRQKLKLVEEERDTLRTSLKQEELAKIAAEGRIPLPPSTPDAEFASPKKRRSRLTTTPKARQFSNKENQDPVNWYVYPEWMGGELQTLRDQVRGLEWAHRSALETIDFMQVECQLKSCPCRLAESRGQEYVYKPDLIQLIERSAQECGVPSSLESSQSGIASPAHAGTHTTKETATANLAEPHEAHIDKDAILSQTENSTPNKHTEHVTPPPLHEDEMVEYSPRTGTFRRVSGAPQSSSSVSSPHISPSSPGGSPTPGCLAVPLEPVTLSESPSVLSLNGQQPRSSDQIQRPSDECMVLPQSSPSTPQVESRVDSEHSEEQEVTPQARSFPSPLEFPPTPGADLTLTAPLNFQIPTNFAHLSQLNNSKPVEQDDIDSFVAGLHEETIKTPTTPHGHPSLASPLRVPKTADARMDTAAASTAFDSSPIGHNEMTGSRLVEQTTTTTVPLADPANSPRKFPYSPGASKTREEALASIQRWRKGRSQSVTAMVGGTPRRVASGIEARRDISAPTPIRTKSRGS